MSAAEDAGKVEKAGTTPHPTRISLIAGALPAADASTRFRIHLAAISSLLLDVALSSSATYK